MHDLTVMVIEDEDLLLKAITKKLTQNEIKTVSCIEGKQALDYLANFKETGELPDAIWLDYYLKDTNGLNLISDMKKIIDVNKIPIVVVSNSASQEKVNNMLALGVDKYFLKAQYRLDDLINEVIKLIKERSLN